MRMPYMVENDVDAYGFLFDASEFRPGDAVGGSRLQPYPVMLDALSVSWEPGHLSVKPNIIRHNRLPDFAVDGSALRVLEDAVDGEIRVYATLLSDREVFSVVQVTEILDVVDAEYSIPSRYSWQEFSFPHIPERFYSDTENKIFKIPNRGFSSSVFIGDNIKKAYKDANLTGWLFHEAKVLQEE
jgi:hypothetical protein